MTCQEAVEWMQRNLDHDLDDSEREKMMAHVSQCRDCTEMYTRLQQLSHELASLPRVMPPFSLVDSILPQLDEIDRMRIRDKTEEHLSATSHHVPVIPSSKRWMSQWKRVFPLGTIGGVVAAGVMIALFITNTDSGMMKRSNSDSGFMSMELSDRKSDTPASQKSGSSGGKSSASSALPAGSADVQKMKEAAIAPTTTPTEPVVSSTAKEIAPNKSDEAQDGGQQQRIASPGPTNVPQSGEGVPKSGGDSVSISKAKGGDKAAQPYNDDAANADILNNSTASSNQPDANSNSFQANTALTSKDQAGSSADKSNEGKPTERLTTPPLMGASIAGERGKVESSSSNEKLPALDGNANYGLVAPNTPVVRMESTDQQLVAIYNKETRRVVVAKTADEKQIVFTSEHQWGEKDLVLLNGWSKSTTFSYTVTQGEVKKSFVIDVESKKETAEPLDLSGSAVAK